MINTGFTDLMINELKYKPNEIFFSLAKMNNTTMSEGTVNDSSIFASLLKTSPDYIPMVPEHWLFQEIPSHNYQLFVSIAFLVLGVPANIGHILVFLAFVRSKKLRTPSNRFLISLLLGDFLLLANCYFNAYQGFKGGPVFGPQGCTISGFIGSVAALSEILSLATVSLDRFLVIQYPLIKRKQFSKNQANGMILLVWATAIMFSIFPLVGWNRYVSESCLMGCAFDFYSPGWHYRSYVIVLLFVFYLFPLLVIFGSYIGIFQSNRSSRKDLLRIRRKNTSYRSKIFQKKTRRRSNHFRRVRSGWKLAKMSFRLIIIWLLAWTPYAMLCLVGIFLDSKKLTPTVGLVPLVFCKMSAAANVMLYGLRIPSFKAEVRTMLFSSLPYSLRCYVPNSIESKSSSPDFSKTNSKLKSRPHPPASLALKPQKCQLNCWNIIMKRQKSVFTFLVNFSNVIKHSFITKEIRDEKEIRFNSYSHEGQEVVRLFSEVRSNRRRRGTALFNGDIIDPPFYIKENVHSTHSLPIIQKDASSCSSDIHTTKGCNTIAKKDFNTVIIVHQSNYTQAKITANKSYIPHDIINDIPFIDEDDVETR